MRILLLNQFFAPDPAPTGQLLRDVAVSLAEQGHDVTVVCSDSSYAESSTEYHTCQTPGVTVKRIGVSTFGHGPLNRIASYATFYAGALRHSLCGPSWDAVLTLTTPPLLSLAGTLSKRLRGTKHFIWEMDVYPDIAVALAVFRSGSVIERMVGALADFSRRHADGIIALGDCMRSRLVGRGVLAEKIAIAENWVDSRVIAPRPLPLNLPLVALYSGNLGLAHDIETIAEAMKQLSDPARFRLVFAGGGSRRSELESYCKAERLENVSFLAYQDENRLAAHLGSCHIGLVTQNYATCGAVVPSKAYALMAAGRPLVFIGPSQATPALNIARFDCGWQVNPGDVRSLVDLFHVLASHPNMIRLAGARARIAFENNFERKQGVSRVVQCFSSEPISELSRVRTHRAGI